MSWYVLQVMTGKEMRVTQRLREHGLDAMTPVRTLRERRGGEWFEIRRAALPGYVFVSCDMRAEVYYTAMLTPDVVAVLGREPGRINPVPDRQMIVVLALNEADGISRGEIGPDGRLRITDGPLKDSALSDQIVRYDRRRARATVELALGGETVRIGMTVMTD